MTRNPLASHQAMAWLMILGLLVCLFMTLPANASTDEGRTPPIVPPSVQRADTSAKNTLSPAENNIVTKDIPVEKGGGRSLGSWSNKNSQMILWEHWYSSIEPSGILSNGLFAGLPNTEKSGQPYFHTPVDAVKFFRGAKAHRENGQYQLAAQWLALEFSVHTASIDSSSTGYVGDLNTNGEDEADYWEVSDILSHVSDNWPDWDDDTRMYWQEVLAATNSNTKFTNPSGLVLPGDHSGTSEISEGSLSPLAVPTTQEQSPSVLTNLSMFFIPNEGQTDPDVLFTTSGQGYTIYFTSDRIVTSVPYEEEGDTGRAVIVQRFAGARTDPVVEGRDPLETTVSYFTGTVSERQTNITPYHAIVYRDLYPGIDVVHHGDSGQIKREYLIEAGADPYQIRLMYEGARQVSITDEGYLVISAGTIEIRESPPFCYQEIDGNMVEIPCRFDQQPDGNITFRIGEYDRSKPLVIDPALSYYGYIGGSSADRSYAITADSNGNTYLTGRTTSTTLYPDIGGLDPTYHGYGDAFVAKVNAAGTSLVYCGYIGGANEDIGNDIAVDSAGNAYVIGQTNSPDLPASTTYGGGYDAFVAKVTAEGTGLDYCRYIGGTADDYGYGIVTDGSGYVYLTGSTDSSNFPTMVGPDTSHNSYSDAFVAKLNQDGSAFVYCGFIGGAGDDTGNSIAINSNDGTAYITGFTDSDANKFPETMGPDLIYNGEGDAFVARVNTAGTLLLYCGYIGGSDYDEGNGIVVDGEGSAYIVGYTQSTEGSFPETIGPDLTFGGIVDAFVAKVHTGAGLSYCGFIGGEKDDLGYGVAVNTSGNSLVTGFTYSNETSSFPVSPDSTLDITHNGQADAFLTKLNASGAGLSYSGYIGGTGNDFGRDISVDSYDNVYITGYSSSVSFPDYGDPGDLVYMGGTYDAFIGKFSTAVSPKAQFSAVPTSGLAPLTVQFTDESTGTGPLTHQWDFTNDGVVDSDEQNPSYSFPAGTYDVKLTVTGPGGSDEEIKVGYISVLYVQPLPGQTNPPTDPDADGTYEDLNGNGETDFNDVQLLFRWMDWIQENEPVSLFDLNNNDEIDFNDVQLLFREV